MASTSTVPTTSDTLVLFARAVIARLDLWQALRIAVNEGWGDGHGAEKRTYLASEIVDAFETVQPLPDDAYVEEILLEAMAQEFEMVLEDGSASIVANDIVRLWDDVQQGKVDFVLKLEQQAALVKGKKVEVKEGAAEPSEEWIDSEEDESGSDSEEEAPQLIAQTERAPRPEPEIDEDGFTMVKKGRK